MTSSALGGGLGRPRRSGIPLQKERGNVDVPRSVLHFVLESTKERVERIKASVDIDALYSERKIQVERIISERDYVALLRVYNNKGLHAEANRVLGIGNYRDMVLRMLKSDKGYEMLAALRAVTPVISC